ncbi:hypothetical protein DXU07_02425 [Bradyrhizobium elkanii]
MVADELRREADVFLEPDTLRASIERPPHSITPRMTPAALRRWLTRHARKWEAQTGVSQALRYEPDSAYSGR